MSGRKRWIWIAMTSLIQSANIPAPPCMLTTPSCTVQYLGAKDCDILQQDLTSLNTWSHESNLKFNASKCGVLTITWRKSPVIHEYHLGDVILQRVQEVKDLGVTISSNLSWDLHVTRIVLKANRMLGLVLLLPTSKLGGLFIYPSWNHSFPMRQWYGPLLVSS